MSDLAQVHLSPREIQILELLSRGDIVPMAAGKLGISPFTVNHHLRRAYKKLRVNNATAACIEATRLNLLFRPVVISNPAALSFSLSLKQATLF